MSGISFFRKPPGMLGRNNPWIHARKQFSPLPDHAPEETITRREDGIVVMDYEQCTGCELCIEACPYYAISIDADKGIAQKCNLCYHRVEQGLLPACADNICLAHCIFFGDPEEISQTASL